MTYEVHPAARLFPRLEGKQFEELFFDIAMNGLREPVVVRGLEIVDGRNRLRAALRAGGTVRFEELGDDVDVYAFVSSANLYRRHLTTSQRVMLLVSRRPSSVQIAPGELHCAVARSVIVSESVPAGRTLTFQARSLPLVLRHTRLMLPPLTRNAALIFFQPAASSSVNARSNVKSAPVCSSGTFEKLAVSGVPASSATVVDGLLLSWTGVVLVRADGPLGPAGAVAGQRDRHRIVAVRVDGDPPAVAPAVDVRGAAHVAVRDRERMVPFSRGQGVPVPFRMTSRDDLAESGRPPGAPRGPQCSEHLKRTCAPAVQPPMDAPWGVCAVERQYRDRQASGRAHSILQRGGSN